MTASTDKFLAEGIAYGQQCAIDQKVTDDQAMSDALAAAASDKVAAVAAQQTLDAAALASAVSAQKNIDDKTTAAVQKAYDDYVANHHNPDPVVNEVIEFSDFAAVQAGAALSGMVTEDKSLVGKGVGKTIVQMKPKTSTKRAVVEALVKPATNQYRLMRVGGNSKSYPNIEIANFTLQGTDQGHAYGGMNLEYSEGLKVHDVQVNAIPGFDSGPPGETFPVSMWHCSNPTLTNVKVDGRDATGKAISATLFGNNFTTGLVTFNNCVGQYAAAGFAVALWRCTSHQVFNGCDFRFCRKAINIEQAIGAVYDFYDCDFRGTIGAAYMAQVSSITKSAVVNFYDPIVDAGTIPKVRTYGASANGGLNVQKDSDIHCYIAGKDVTNDSTKFQITHQG